MLITFFIRLLQMLVLITLQVLVLNHVQFWGYGTPLIGAAILLYMPMGSSRVGTLLWAFVTGLVLDIFSSTPGISSGALTLTAMVQPSILAAMAPRDAADNLLPTYDSMGRWNHIRYLMILILVHHLAYFFLESFSIIGIGQTLLYMCSSWATSVIVVMLLEGFRDRGK